MNSLEWLERKDDTRRCMYSLSNVILAYAHPKHALYAPSKFFLIRSWFHAIHDVFMPWVSLLKGGILCSECLHGKGSSHVYTIQAHIIIFKPGKKSSNTLLYRPYCATPVKDHHTWICTITDALLFHQKHTNVML